MASSWRDEHAGLLTTAGNEQLPDDVEGCSPVAAGSRAVTPTVTSGSNARTQRVLLVVFAATALAVVAVSAVALGSQATVDKANLHNLVMEQVWQQSTQSATGASTQSATVSTGATAYGTATDSTATAVTGGSTGAATTGYGTATGGYGTATGGSTAYATEPEGESEAESESESEAEAEAEYGTYETTIPPYTGPIEFNGKGGPPTVAGTKLISAGAENTDALPHAPVPEPPEDYEQENPPFTMYMYRAQSETNYPMRNVNTADLAGVLWYLHNEIVAFPDPDYRIRHFNISRIIRFKVTIQNPSEFFERHHRKFGAYVAFGAGKCSVPHCDSLWKKYGAVVGCQAADTKVANYRSLWRTQTDDSQCTDGCNAPIWYSLPGPCPSHEYGAKSADCVWNYPGGDCGKDKDVNGARDCTYFAQWYGQVHLDELLNFTFEDGRRATFAQFLAAGGVEYDKESDKGTYTSFWDGVHDEDAGKQRVAAVRYLFATKYPKYPTELQETEVPCDFSGWDHLEFSPDPAPGSQP